jgi:tripartite ATP-independent transporter DctM subunit
LSNIIGVTTGVAPAEAPDAPAPRSRVLTRIDNALASITETAVAALVVAEVVLLGSSTVARYLFGRPLIWSDELATMLFLWLAMLGAVVALRRGEHMRLTAFVRDLPASKRAWLDALGTSISIAILLALAEPAYEHFDDLRVGLSPVMEISEGYRAAAILVGVVLMLITAIDKLLQQATWPQILAAVLFVAVATGGLTELAPALEDAGNINLVIFFVVFVVFCMVIGMPIAFAFLLGTICFISFTTSVPLTIVPSRMDEGMSQIILLAVPMFVLLGALIEMTGLARAMINFLVSLIGHRRGGLQYVLLGAMYLVSGISGAKAADMAAVAPALFPEMRKRGNNDGQMISLLSAAAVMSETIPPSIVLITVGSVTGVSIAALFTGGLLPAVVGMIALAVVVFVQCRNEDMSHALRFSWPSKGKLFLVAIPALGLPIVIRTSVVDGIATATEVSSIGVLYAAIVGICVYRQFDWRKLRPMLIDTASLSGAILLVVGAATSMAWALTQSGFSRQLVNVMVSVPGGKAGFLAVSAAAFIVLGSVLEGVPAIVLFGPLLFPIARIMGVNEIHYAIVAVFSMGFGLFTPPFGVGFYLACAIGRVSPDIAIRHVWPHLAALLVALIIIAAIPWISTGFL